MTETYRIAALGGEGVGPEVVEASLRVVLAAAERHGVRIEVEHGDFGIPAFEKHGSHFPDHVAELCGRSNGVLLGAVEKGGLLALRRRFDFFANLRPVKAIDCLLHTSSLQPDRIRGLDILFVRELTSGIYFGDSGRSSDERGDFGFHRMVYYDDEVRRVARVALEHAQKRRKRLTVTHKENALPKIPWCEITKEEAARFPDVTVENMLVDTLGMELVMNPLRFDTILAGNLIGDWSSSIGGALVGSIGLLPSASLNADGFGLYEAIHGTAPEIAGRGIANPLGTLASATLMIHGWGETAMADAIDAAVDRVLATGCRTPDIAAEGEPTLTTEALTDRIIEQLGRSASSA